MCEDHRNTISRVRIESLWSRYFCQALRSQMFNLIANFNQLVIDVLSW